MNSYARFLEVAQTGDAPDAKAAAAPGIESKGISNVISINLNHNN